ASPSCRFNKWSTLSDDCKIDLPKITNADYEKYKLDKNMRRIYSMLWGATYEYGWDVGNGSHLGIDIATSEGTPVKSIGDGEVIIAGWVSGYGNTVSIKHQISNGKYIYSNYSHLSKITAVKGPIKIGEIIGEVGNTGNSYGNHLHFQIDITNQFHPYWYTTCSKGVDIMSVVNGGMCKDFMLANTVDPILFIESGGTFTQITQIQQKQKEIPKINPKSIKSREQILEEEIQDFFIRHSLQFKISAPGGNVEIGKTYIAKILVNNYNRPFNGTMPAEGLDFIYDKKALKIFPEKIILIEKGVREIYITGLKSGIQKIDLKIGKKIIASATVNVYSNKELSSPGDANILIKGKNFIIGEERLGGVIFKTKFGSNQINIPYDGRYKLSLLTGKAKFCNVSDKLQKKCNNIELSTELEFSYEDTYKGVLLFNVVPTDYMPIKFSLQKIGSKYEITRTRYQMPIKNPTNLNSDYVYFTECISALKKVLIRLNNGYLLQERDFIGKQAKEIINNYFAYEFLKAGNNLNKKQNIKDQILKFNQNITSLNDYKIITRGEFAKYIIDNLNITLVKNNDKIWMDESGEYKDYITTLRVLGFTWKDQFGTRYFQSDKKLTVGEALYLISKF
ncbi:M23 family metallopeptidase, partial [Candidatus Gracilibacteria bacterium]|nr:M23 family metallopeptidase [Candidatus Gracilibacteria bacterium]